MGIQPTSMRYSDFKTRSTIHPKPAHITRLNRSKASNHNPSNFFFCLPVPGSFISTLCSIIHSLSILPFSTSASACSGVIRSSWIAASIMACSDGLGGAALVARSTKLKPGFRLLGTVPIADCSRPVTPSKSAKLIRLIRPTRRELARWTVCNRQQTCGLPTQSRDVFDISTTVMLGTPTTSCLVSAAVCCLGVGIEFAVHALQHLAIDIWLRIAFDVVFASSLSLASGKRLQDDAGSFYASMCLPRDNWREVFGGASELFQFVQ